MFRSHHWWGIKRGKRNFIWWSYAHSIKMEYEMLWTIKKHKKRRLRQCLGLYTTNLTQKSYLHNKSFPITTTTTTTTTTAAAAATTTTTTTTTTTAATTTTITATCTTKRQWPRYRPGVAQRVDRGIALLFHDCGTRGGEWSAARPGLLLLLLVVVRIIIIPWKRVLSERLTCSQLVRKFPSLHGLRMFFTSLLLFPVLKQMNPTYAILSFFFKVCLNIPLSSILTSSKWSLSFSFPTAALGALLLSPIHAICPARFIIHG